MRIEELNERYYEEVKDLLVELQEYIVEIDDFKLNVISKEYREKYFEYMVEDCNKNQGKIYVAIDDEKVIGMIAGFVQCYDKRDKLDYACLKKGLVAELVVSKNVRSKGVGTNLLDTLEKYFISIGCEYVQIEVFAPNETAKSFYYKKGYQNRMISLFKKL